LRRRIGKLERPLLAAAGREEREESGRSERAYHPGIMTETEFHTAVDAVLSRVEDALESAGDLDVSLEGGVLTIECPDASRIIVNRQTPNREIWVAARSGGFHFRQGDGEWRDTRSMEELFTSLSRLIHAQSGVEVRFD
jgi:CyaY protein